MIDRETAIQWANEVGMINFDGANWQCVTDQIQRIITRAQNESCEKETQGFVIAARFEVIQKICTLGQNKSLAVDQGELLDLFNHMENEITLLRSAVARCIAFK